MKEREQAIDLRHRGFTYREILTKVPVAKSTLSVWLGGIGLTKKQEQRISEKKHAAMLRGSAARHRQRIESTKKIHGKAFSQIGRISRRDLWMLGIALYWAEGSKQKMKYPGVGIMFANSDPHMIAAFSLWLRSAVRVKKNDIRYELYVHQSHGYRLKEIQKHWAKELSVPLKEFDTVYFKKNSVAIDRKNAENTYYGLVRLRVGKSANLNRTVTGWIDGIVHGLRAQSWGIV